MASPWARAAISRPGSVARASAAASAASALTSTASLGRSCTSPRRASVSRSSTSTPMRADSSSIRDIAFSVSAGFRAAPMRNSSAYPRIEASGVRSSWDTSARKRRSRPSVASRWVKASSSRSSIEFSARPRRPTSVLSLAVSTRWDRSPAAMASAVWPMRSSGRRPARTSTKDSSCEQRQHPGDHEPLHKQQPVQGVLDPLERDRHDREPAVGAGRGPHAVAQAAAALRVHREGPGRP